MSTQIINRVLSVGEGRTMKTLLKRATSVGELEEEYAALDIAGIRAKTAELKDRYRDGEGLDDLMQEAFALVREAAKRSLNSDGVDSSAVTTQALLPRSVEDLEKEHPEWNVTRGPEDGRCGCTTFSWSAPTSCMRARSRR